MSDPVRCKCGMPHLGGTEHADECPVGILAANPFLTRAEETVSLRQQLAGAVEALEQIADPECMTRGTGGWIDTGAPARIAQNALDALGVSGVTP